IKEEDDLHKDDVTQDDEHRSHDDAARRRFTDAFSATAGSEPEIAPSDRDQVTEDDRLERRWNEIRVRDVGERALEVEAPGHPRDSDLGQVAAENPRKVHHQRE